MDNDPASSELAALLGWDPADPRLQAAREDAAAAERLLDTLVELRTGQGLTQREIARRMETTQSAVSKFEHAGGDPRLSTLHRYARAVGARLRWHVATSARDSDIWRSRYPLPADDPGEPSGEAPATGPDQPEGEVIETTPTIRLAS